jgi:hypothetical protein
MHVAVRRYSSSPDRHAELARRVQEGFLPIVSGVEGFEGYYLVASPDGAVVSVGIFTDADGAHASTTAASGWVRDNIADLVDGPPEVVEGTVLARA